jgi:hypothetical protein
MKLGVAAAEMAGNTGTSVRLADFANLTVFVWGDERESFSRLKLSRSGKFDFWSPNSACDMDPVITISPLQRFSGTDRLAYGLLPLSIELDSFINHFLLEPLFFPIPFSLLLVRRLWSLHQFMRSPGHRTQDTFVASRNQRISIVSTHITQPFSVIP